MGKVRLCLYAAMLFQLCSCSVYDSSFQCRPGKGIGCTPAGEVVSLIVEREEGEDLFYKEKGAAKVRRKEEEENKQDAVFILERDAKGNLVLVQERETQEYK